MKSINRIRLRIVLSFFSLLFSSFIFAQSRGVDHGGNNSLESNNFYKKTWFGFSISPYVVSKAQTKPLAGDYRLTNVRKYGFEAGFDFHFNITKNYSIISGLHGGAAATNHKLYIPGSDFNPPLSGSVDDNGQLTSQWGYYANLPILLQRKWIRKSNNFWSIVGGVNVRFYPVGRSYYGFEEIYPDGNGNQISVVKINAIMGNNLRPWLNYNIGGGYTILLSNNNYLQCLLLTNYSNKKIIDGTYEINVTGKPLSTGKYSANMSYIGLSFSYILTGANKRMRKFYEQNLR